MDDFVNRTEELAALERWWERGGQAAVVWGRRRVGKTALAQRFARNKLAVFHTGAGRGEPGELRLLSDKVAHAFEASGGLRNPAERPYTDWDDALDDLADRAADEPALLVLDEFPELVASSPALPGIVRAFLDRARNRTQLRILLSGSAVRYMEALQEHREPLYGRFDLALPLHPFNPREAALMLPRLSPEDRALVYGIAGGMPLYLSWWDQDVPLEENLRRLVTEPGGRLLTEGDLVMRADLDSGEKTHRVLYAVAAGKVTHHEIKDWVGSEPTRAIERLIDLRLVERVHPVGEPDRTRRRRYRILDPHLRFHLGVVAKYRTDIERGLGSSLLPVLMEALDDHMGDVWEEAFRGHLRHLAAVGALPIDQPVVGVGPWWSPDGTNEIDGLVLAGRSATPVLAGEAKWTRSPHAPRLVAKLRRKVEDGVGLDPDDLSYALCVRSELSDPPDGALALTASDLFAPP